MDVPSSPEGGSKMISFLVLVRNKMEGGGRGGPRARETCQDGTAVAFCQGEWQRLLFLLFLNVTVAHLNVRSVPALQK